MLLKLVLCSGLWVMVFAESSDTSSVDDSNDTPSKLNAEFIKSRSAGRDMSYSSSFGSEDFDSPDIPSDFHARWGANKSWYVKTPHPILSRRETYEEYGQAPVVLDSADSSEPDPTEASPTDGQTPVTLYNAIENLVSIPNEVSATDGQTPVTLNNAIENPVSIPYRSFQSRLFQHQVATSKEQRGGVEGVQTVGAPDLTKPVYRSKVDTFLRSQIKTKEELKLIELETRSQRDSELWLSLRRNLLTASNFGAVCRRQAHTPCDSLVNRMLYGVQLNLSCMEYGRENEEIAVAQVEKKGIDVSPCGMFIDEDDPFLAATPDGLIGENGLLEIKCPFSAGHLTPEEAIVRRKGMMSTFWRVSEGKIMEINTNHTYYYQIQGQLHITRRKYCLFVVWTPKGIRIERIEKDNDFWRNCMYAKLRAFYMNCLLPEIIDSRRTRNLPIRNPQYILDAINMRFMNTTASHIQKIRLTSQIKYS